MLHANEAAGLVVTSEPAIRRQLINIELQIKQMAEMGKGNFDYTLPSDGFVEPVIKELHNNGYVAERVAYQTINIKWYEG